MSERGIERSKEWGDWQYVTQINVRTCRQRIESGYSLDNFDERAEAEIQSEDVFSGHRQITAGNVEDALPTVDTSQLDPTVSDPGTVREGTDTDQLRTDGGIVSKDGRPQRFIDLVDFRRDMLLTIACFGPSNGKALEADLSRLRNEDVNDGRFYPHLNALVDDDLVDKRENKHDNRSHEYALSGRGRTAIREHAQKLIAAIGAIDRGGTDR